MIVIGQVVNLASILGAAASVGGEYDRQSGQDDHDNLDTMLLRRLEDGTGGR
jgi:hypothetical protein